VLLGNLQKTPKLAKYIGLTAGMVLEARSSRKVRWRLIFASKTSSKTAGYEVRERRYLWLLACLRRNAINLR
jgi:hypothetical protein